MLWVSYFQNEKFIPLFDCHAVLHLHQAGYGRRVWSMFLTSIYWCVWALYDKLKKSQFVINSFCWFSSLGVNWQGNIHTNGVNTILPWKWKQCWQCRLFFTGRWKLKFLCAANLNANTHFLVVVCLIRSTTSVPSICKEDF